MVSLPPRWADRFALWRSSAYCGHLADRLAAGGQHVRAARLLAQAARRGDPAAQMRIGQCYLSGLGVPPSRAEAARWMERAAEAGHPPAQYAYAALLWSGEGAAEAFPLSLWPDPGLAPGDDRQRAARRWARRAAAAGMAEAQALLGQMLCFGPEDMRDLPRGEACFAQAAAAGLAEGQLGLALLAYRRAEGAPAMAAEARRWFAQAAEGGSPYAVFALAVMAEAEARDDAGWRVAAGFYAQAAQRGHRAGQARWGRLLAAGIGCTRNLVEGESWLRHAALAGDAEAAAWLGDHYAEVQSALPPNLVEAARWYRHAVDLGHGRAALALGRLYRDGLGGADAREAAACFSMAAVRGEMAAWEELRALTLAGLVPQDMLIETVERLPAGQYWYGRALLQTATTDSEQAEARLWIGRAADSGVVNAQAVLAEMMLHGRGGARDMKAALDLFETAAAAGHLGALFALGVLYAGVEGVAPDLSRSRALLQEAARRGHAPAEAELARFAAAGLYAGLPDG